jgi:hypothetical protein
MKKFGYFCLAFVPLIITYAYEFAASFFMMGMSALFSSASGIRSGQLMDYLYEVWMDTGFNTVIMIIFSLTCTCTFGLWYYYRCEGEYLPRRKTTLHPLMFAAVAILVPGTQYAAGFISGILAEIFPSWLEAYEELLDSAGMSGNISFLMVCYSVILAPISEELIFRGVTLRYARLALPFWLANLFQAVMFGIFHGNWLQGCYAAALGLVLGYVCEKGGSIYYSMFLHFLFNFWGTVLTEVLTFDSMSDEVYTVMVIGIMIVSLVLGFVLFHVGLKKRAERNARPAVHAF